MSEDKVNTTFENVQNSVASIYSELLNKRRIEKEIKEEKKRIEKETKRIDKGLESPESEDSKPISKKEKRAAEIESWRDIIVSLTGEDIDCIPPKKNKKKYKKWINEETGDNVILTSKPIKKKKKNYNKEFEPEINMLKALVADQNRFTADLQKRYQTAAGPNTKEASPLNKTLVELASVINNSRGNAYAVLREIGNLKHKIADLTMKQKKIDSEGGGGGSDNTDLALFGSNVAANMFGGGRNFDNPPIPAIGGEIPVPSQNMYQSQETKNFDPNTWDGGGIEDNVTKYESIPHTVMVEWHKERDVARFKAVRNDTGEELVDCPVPVCTIKAIDVNSKIAKDDFDQIYRLEIIE